MSTNGVNDGNALQHIEPAEKEDQISLRKSMENLRLRDDGNGQNRGYQLEDPFLRQ